MRGQPAVTTTASDPFGEHSPTPLRAHLRVLGAAFTVESSNAAALQLAIDAFGGMPRQRLETGARRFRMRLVVTPHRSTWLHGAKPPQPMLTAGTDLLCATVDAGNFAVIDVAQARALVSLSPAMLRRPYYARYELIELAMLTLASRGQSLVPLHAACIGARGAGILLMGPSGAGKSTLALHALAARMQLLSEDSAFVALDTLQVTGTPSYVHVTPDATRFLAEDALLQSIRRSPQISRRSGTRKYEVDVRRLPGKLAAAPLELAAVVFLSRRGAPPGNALAAIGRKALLMRLNREQPYAANLPEWREFERRITHVPAYELRRPPHPDDAVAELRAMLP